PHTLNQLTSQINYRTARTHAEYNLKALCHPNCRAHLLHKAPVAAASYPQILSRKRRRYLSAPAESEPAADGTSSCATTPQRLQSCSGKQTTYPAERRANSNPNIQDEIPLQPRSRTESHL